MVQPDYHLTVKELPEELRPRERLRRDGASALSNKELLAIILRTGTRSESVLDLASRLLTVHGGLRGLVSVTLDELSTISGIGTAKAAMIRAALELGKRVSSMAPEVRPVIRSPQDVSILLMEEMRHLDREQFRTVLLNTKNQVLETEVVSVGSLSSSIVHPREVFKNPIKKSAAALILVHNHPSGDPTPSREDIEVTNRLAEAGKILGIEILDHIIIGDNKYSSLKEKGLI
ncbi:MAG: DNA repair protein RadC [Clostridia bacterium]|nr:DNA repair protein RadC [Clostridia bacterium]